METMPHWLDKQATLSPEKIAIEKNNGETLTFLQLQKKSRIFAKKLASLGIKKESKVAMLSANHVDMVISFFALTYLEAVTVMLNTRLSKQELHYQIEQSKSSLVITTEDIIKQKNLSFKTQMTFKDIHDLEAKPCILGTEITLDAPCTMMFTSGTTGKPKAVIHTYGNHWWSAISSALNLGLDKQDKWLLTLPIFHVGGLSIIIRSVIYGISILLLEKYDEKDVYHALMEKEVTIASLVTLMLSQLLDRLADEALPDTVRCLLLGGGSVPEALLKKVEEKQMPLFQSYGMTETSSQIVTLSAAYALKKLGSSGKPLFPAEIRIENPNAQGVGEIEVKGPMVMKGYSENKEANLTSFSGDWLKTGDIGYVDADGFLYVLDRRTDLIISGGENIYPSEIENELLDIPGVIEAAVVGKADKTWGQIPVAFIVRKSAQLTADNIKDHLKQTVATYKTPKQIIFIDALPRNASNKVMRHRLADKIN